MLNLVIQFLKLNLYNSVNYYLHYCVSLSRHLHITLRLYKLWILYITKDYLIYYRDLMQLISMLSCHKWFHNYHINKVDVKQRTWSTVLHYQFWKWILICYKCYITNGRYLYCMCVFTLLKQFVTFCDSSLPFAPWTPFFIAVRIENHKIFQKKNLDYNFCERGKRKKKRGEVWWFERFVFVMHILGKAVKLFKMYFLSIFRKSNNTKLTNIMNSTQ